jgi:glycine/D-amino acid oxidase-like deaminating enzyme
MSTIDRRDFLKVAGAQAGLLLAAAAVDPLPPAAATSPERSRAPAIGAPLRDVVVVGAGAFGGWTAYYLRKMGARVTVVDTWGPGNSRATSGEETRGVRTSYGDRAHGETWMRWANEAVQRWKKWDEEWGRELKMRLFFTTGDLIFRANWEPFVYETKRLWEKVGVQHDVLTIPDVKHRWPVIDVHDMGFALYEPQAGVVRARRACQSVAGVFEKLGGKSIIAQAKLPEKRSGPLTELSLLGGAPALKADTYVFALGPWMPKIFPELLKNKMRTPMGYVFYYGTPANDERFVYPNLPSYNFPGVTGWPGLPDDNRGFRVRTGGGGASAQDPDASERWIDPRGLERARNFVTERFPALKEAPLNETRACHYELSVSRNFIFDRHPDMPNVFLAGGGSAEGFKFGPMVGEYVAKRVLGMPTDPALDEQFKIPKEEFEDPNAPRRDSTGVVPNGNIAGGRGGAGGDSTRTGGRGARGGGRGTGVRPDSSTARPPVPPVRPDSTRPVPNPGSTPEEEWLSWVGQ